MKEVEVPPQNQLAMGGVTQLLISSVMDAYGNLHKEHASDEYGRAMAFGPQYMRSCPLNSIRLMLRNQISWGSNFKFFGRANFRSFVLEWTESILSDFGDVLRQADMYGAVAISRYSYDFCPNVWRAFYEL
ncbi:hypothetical protein L3X38_036536 [Prunus dulcis]|uniref:Uncharacterized protein n=1 Tax=Prunus dulcis TaxID=3755 RepID=A0AAD4V1N8_PRUDU|nr:hypothetical protein L3X38_036536 [Prunus dulcis]